MPLNKETTLIFQLTRIISDRKYGNKLNLNLCLLNILIFKKNFILFYNFSIWLSLKFHQGEYIFFNLIIIEISSRRIYIFQFEYHWNFIKENIYFSIWVSLKFHQGEYIFFNLSIIEISSRRIYIFQFEYHWNFIKENIYFSIWVSLKFHQGEYIFFNLSIIEISSRRIYIYFIRESPVELSHKSQTD